MDVTGECWKNFKGFIEDHFNDELSVDIDFKVTPSGAVFLINRSEQLYGTLFDCADDSWVTALDLQKL